jgi:tRNA(fMet)-specific endonuclease VapC
LSFLIDTNVVIHLRDGDEDIVRNMAELHALPAIAMITRIELENGLYRDPELTDLLRPNLSAILHRTKVIDFGNMEFEAYRSILAQVGFSKRKVLDRMIAATALAHDLTLITMNGKDFRDVPELKLVEWQTPEAG